MRRESKLRMTTAQFTLEIRYNAHKTNPINLAVALDTLLETALSTPGVLDDHGRIEVGRDGFVPESKLSKTHAECQNCGKVWPVARLDDIEDVHSRVGVGEPMPAGECPECGAVCHPVEK